jgi:hypothetical protein
VHGIENCDNQNRARNSANYLAGHFYLNELVFAYVIRIVRWEDKSNVNEKQAIRDQEANDQADVAKTLKAFFFCENLRVRTLLHVLAEWMGVRKLKAQLNESNRLAPFESNFEAMHQTWNEEPRPVPPRIKGHPTHSYRGNHAGDARIVEQPQRQVGHYDVLKLD